MGVYSALRMADAVEQMPAEFDTAFKSMKELVSTTPCVMYTTAVCPFCDYAKEFLAGLGKQCHGVALNDAEHRITASVVVAVTKQRTVPNIFVHGVHIGGFDALKDFEKQCRSPGSAVLSDSEVAPACKF